MALLVSCCSENPEPTPLTSEIKIEYQAAMNSRSATAYGKVSDITSFHVWCLTEDGVPYIPGDKIIRESGNNSFVPADGQYRYWPKPGYKLGFLAISGADEEEEIVWTKDSKGNDACTVLKNYRMVKDMESKKDPGEEKPMHLSLNREFDLLISPRGIIASPEKDNFSSAPVDLNFQHALSCIELRARNINPALDIEITGIGLKHIQNIGDLRAYLVGDSAGTYKWELPILEDTQKPTFKIDLGRAVRLHGSIDAVTDESLTSQLPRRETDWTPDSVSRYAMMMIPQQLNIFNTTDRPHGSSLMICVNIWNVASDNGIHDANDKKIWGNVNDLEGEWMMIPCGDTWLPGKKYIYTITFGAEGANGGYQEDESKPDKDRVFDPISVSVEIEPWIAGGEIVQNIY